MVQIGQLWNKNLKTCLRTTHKKDLLHPREAREILAADSETSQKESIDEHF